MNKPKILLVDIETAPILGYVWGLWDQNVGLNQIHTDWHLLSWSAKWLDSKDILYMDSRNEKNIENDSKLLKGIWKLLNDADIVITQNGKKFDIKKLNTRFILNGFEPPSSFKQIDTLTLAKKHFSFTSNKLAYMTDKLCVKYKKLDHKKFAGFELWKECLAGNLSAWKEMELYNKYDVLALEELYHKMAPWDSSIDFNVYEDGIVNTCKCGNSTFRKEGFVFSVSGKYQRYRCKKCGSQTRSKQNLLTLEKRKSLRPGT